jgi:hypothetical protein
MIKKRYALKNKKNLSRPLQLLSKDKMQRGGLSA